MANSIVAAIILFNPNIERLRKNINSIKDQVDKIFFIDNDSKNIIEIENLFLGYNNDYLLIKNKKNLGIATALNIAFQYAEKDGYKWIITMDQDSIAPTNLVSSLAEIISKNVGIICPLIQDINKKEHIPISNKIVKVQKCITSGSLTNIEAWKKIGGFDEVMFIDGVDFDFCYRLIDSGYLILENRRVLLTHEVGKIKEHKFLGIKIYAMNHTAFRKYYIAKNTVYLYRKHKKTSFPIVSLFKQICLVLLYEEEKMIKLKAIIKGIKDGINEKITN